MSTDTEMQRLTDGPEHNFFGYYDKCPWDESGRYVLSLATQFTNRLPEPEDEARVKIIDTVTGESDTVTTTRAWNFQMGAMLQWRGNGKGQFMFNDREDGRPVSRLYDRDGDSIRAYERPIYACSSDGELAVTLNYERLHRTRPGYGYPAESDGEVDKKAPEDDGLFALDLQSGETKLLVSLAELASYETPDSASQQTHWINHLAFSPDGSRVAFLHRWSLSGNGLFTRLFTFNLETGELNCIIDSGKATHYDWHTPNGIVAWSRREGAIGKSAKNGVFNLPIFRYFVSLYRNIDTPSIVSQRVVGDRYHYYDLQQDRVEPMDGVPDPDGHPSISTDGRWMVTDTYPDADGRRRLYLCDLEVGNFEEVAVLSSQQDHDGTAHRCDLHPRWNRDDTAVCVDSMHEGTRQVYVIDVSEYVN